MYTSSPAEQSPIWKSRIEEVSLPFLFLAAKIASKISTCWNRSLPPKAYGLLASGFWLFSRQFSSLLLESWEF